MIHGKALDLQVDNHVILFIGDNQSEVRRRYIVDKISPESTSIIVQAENPYYNPVYERDQNYFNNMRGQHLEYFAFADRYRIQSSYGSVRAKALGMDAEENDHRPFVNVTRPIDAIDGTAEGAGRNIVYGEIADGPRVSHIGATFVMNPHTPEHTRIDVTLTMIDGQITVLVHPTEGVTPVVSVVQ